MAVILNARVQQKVATKADWLAAEDELGVILDGEQAFEINEEGVLTNFKIGDGTKKYSELPYFITYFSNVLNQKILSFLNGNTDITIPTTFRNFSCLYDIILINNSGGDIDFKVGTSSGGNQLMEVTVPAGVYQINLRKVFQAPTTLFLSGLAGKNYSIILVYFQYDESPATPPTGDPAAFRWPRCFKGMFEPLNDTDLDANWDFLTGFGKPGTAYANCAISGTEGTEDMAGYYAVGAQVGTDSLRPATTFGSDSGAIAITEANIPKFRLKMFSDSNPTGNLRPDADGSKTVTWTSNHTSGNQDYDMKSGDINVQPTLGHTSSFGQDTPDTIDIRPKSKVVLYFVAITD
jgi:hypothetical protein